jgi:hypothetical protein
MQTHGPPFDDVAEQESGRKWPQRGGVARAPMGLRPQEKSTFLSSAMIGKRGVAGGGVSTTTASTGRAGYVTPVRRTASASPGLETLDGVNMCCGGRRRTAQ